MALFSHSFFSFMVSISPRQTPFRIDTSLPGDKSISHRAAMIAALAEGPSIIENYTTGDDGAVTLNGLNELGIPVNRSDSGSLTIEGKGLFGFTPPVQPLYCGNSGTTARLMAGILAGQPFSAVLTGDASLSRRPMRRILEPLSKMQARIRSENNDSLPLYIEGQPLKSIEYRIPLPSAQVKSCLLFAGLHADGTTVLHEPIPTRDHSERLLSAYKGFSRNENTISVKGKQRIEPLRIIIPGDSSSAAYLIAAAVLIPESEIFLRGISLNPTRLRFIQCLRSMGADIIWQYYDASALEPVGDILVRYVSKTLTSMDITEYDVPLLIDELPLLAVIGTQTTEGLTIRHARELRYKESDRIKAVTDNLARMNGRVEAFDDGLMIYPSRLRGAEISSFGDHRIAMAFTIAAFIAKGRSVLSDTECIKISFPEFFQYFQ